MNNTLQVEDILFFTQFTWKKQKNKSKGVNFSDSVTHSHTLSLLHPLYMGVDSLEGCWKTFLKSLEIKVSHPHMPKIDPRSKLFIFSTD